MKGNFVTISVALVFMGWIVWLLWSADTPIAQIGGILLMAVGGALAVVAILVGICGFFWHILCQAAKEAEEKETSPKCCSFRRRF